jgi:predicted rRNA pseudouridine synthase
MQGSTIHAEELNGFIVIDKPKGPTSHQIDYWVRTMLNVERVGHIGTLDPSVSGVLVMALGHSTRLIDIAHEDPKEYVGVMRFHGDVDEKKVRDVFALFTDEIYQIPPVRSAVARTLRKRRIYSLKILEMKGREVLFNVRCDSGTYIRTLCVDIGYVASGGGQLEELRRISTGPFTENMCVTMQDVSDAAELIKKGEDRLLRKILIPPIFLFRDKPKIVIKKSAMSTIAHGSDLYPGGIKAVIGNPVKGDRVCVISEDNSVVGTGIMLTSADEISDVKVVDFDRVLIDPPDVSEKHGEPRKGEMVRYGNQGRNKKVQKFGNRVHGNIPRAEGGKNPHNGRWNNRPQKHPGFEDSHTGIREKKDKRRVHR